jgi:hypothetical protein
MGVKSSRAGGKAKGNLGIFLPRMNVCWVVSEVGLKGETKSFIAAMGAAARESKKSKRADAPGRGAPARIFDICVYPCSSLVGKTRGEVKPK